MSRSEIRLESGGCGVLGRSVDSDGDNAALLGRARSLRRWPRPGGQHGSGGRRWEPRLRLPPGGLTSKNKRPALNDARSLVLCPQIVFHFIHSPKYKPPFAECLCQAAGRAASTVVNSTGSGGRLQALHIVGVQLTVAILPFYVQTVTVAAAGSKCTSKSNKQISPVLQWS